ncbi:MAG TPA: aminoacyl-tRNA hydrolase [Campylobacteraceae bacterium]|nr:aminoacyl-tRNA hydrolase [Campylobacteraceae bacterium]
MTLIVGLGNPTDKYKKNRHNVGFMVIDKLLDDLSPQNITKSTFKGALYKHRDILLLKPMTYMNLSGESVLAVTRYYKTSHLIVIHDELDIALGRIKLKHGGSSGGHNGLKSIDALAGNDYDRIRIGISRPPAGKDVISHVLSDFRQEEWLCVEKVVDIAAQMALELAHSDIKTLQNRYPAKTDYCAGER